MARKTGLPISFVGVLNVKLFSGGAKYAHATLTTNSPVKTNTLSARHQNTNDEFAYETKQRHEISSCQQTVSSIQLRAFLQKHFGQRTRGHFALDAINDKQTDPAYLENTSIYVRIWKILELAPNYLVVSECGSNGFASKNKTEEIVEQLSFFLGLVHNLCATAVVGA